MRKLIVFFSVFVLLLIVFLPQISSTSLGKPFFIKALEARSKATVTVESLSLSWFGPQKFQNVRWVRDNISGTVEELQIAAPFWTFSGPFRVINGSIHSKKGSVEQIEGQIEGNDFDLNGITFEGHISLKGKVYSKVDFDIQVDIQNFPLVILDQQIDQILGPTLDLKGTVSMGKPQGILDLDISAPNLKTHLKGFLTERQFTLTAPLIATIQLTPQLSSLLLKDANPLFLTGIQAKNPITLQIEPKDFSFPLPFNLSKLKVGMATLDLGQVICQNGKSLASLISLLKATRLARAQEMNAWFTPVSFRIDQGILHAGRMDVLLADSIHLCTWGNVNLIKDQLDMILGLPADTLQTSFGIKNLPKNYILKMDVRGTTKEPDIATASAGAKIAALAAAGQIPKKGVFGGIVDIFTKPQEDEYDPPAKRPFPWEK
jgi:hypothetical protein